MESKSIKEELGTGQWLTTQSLDLGGGRKKTRVLREGVCTSEIVIRIFDGDMTSPKITVGRTVLEVPEALEFLSDALTQKCFASVLVGLINGYPSEHFKLIEPILNQYMTIEEK